MAGLPIHLMQNNLADKIRKESPDKQSFWRKLGLGIVGATITSIPLSIGVTIFDRAVIQKVNGSVDSLSGTIKEGFAAAARNPVRVFMAHDNRALFIVYGSTYVTNKSMVATSEYQGWSPLLPVLLTTTVVNTVLGIVKDRYLAQMFGSGIPNFPNTSYGLFTARDMIIVGSSFNLPPYLSPVLQDQFHMKKGLADTVAQLACPGIAQIFATPIHILGLDMYNRPGITWSERFDGLLDKSLKPLKWRMIRQIYVFGVGSIAVRNVCDWIGFNNPTETKADRRR
jgi:hypothetical protein